MDTNSRKRCRDSRTINEKYEIIQFYENLIKKKCKNAKSVCKDYFKLKQISTLNSILNKIDEIKEVYFENQSSEKRIRLKKSLYADVDEELHDYFVKMRHKKAQSIRNRYRKRLQ